MTIPACCRPARASSSRSASARLAALALALVAAWGAPAAAEDFRYIFAVEGGEAAERTVRSENAGSAARGPATVWNAIDARTARTGAGAGALTAEGVPPTSEVSLGAADHLRRNAARVVAVPRRGTASRGGARLSMTQFMNNSGMTGRRAGPPAGGDPGGGDGGADPGGGDRGDGEGGTDRFWEATETGKSLQELYREILGRDIDRSGFATYSDLVDNQGKSLEEIRTVLLESEEYRTRILKLPPEAKTGDDPRPPATGTDEVRTGR